jgi:hypothetical protein
MGVTTWRKHGKPSKTQEQNLLWVSWQAGYVVHVMCVTLITHAIALRGRMCVNVACAWQPFAMKHEGITRCDHTHVPTAQETLEAVWQYNCCIRLQPFFGPLNKVTMP